MALGPRVRERSGRIGTSQPVFMRARQTWVGGAPYGNWSRFSSGFKYSPFYERCEDTVTAPPHPDTNLWIEKLDLQVGFISGIMQDPTSNARQYRHTYTVLSPNSYGDVETGHLAPLSWTGPSDYINKALARANPNRSEINLAQFLWELREVPAMIKNLGDLLLKQKGLTGVPISITFGWKPLINDLKTLLDVSRKIDQKLASLDRLYRKVMKERYTLETRRVNSRINRTYLGLNYSFCRETTLTVWAVKKHTIQGTPFAKPEPFTRAQAFWLAMSEGTIETLWSVLPWSWLIDYFVGIADFLAATGNRVPGYSVLSLCIMHKLETKLWHEQNSNVAGWTGSYKLKPLKGIRTSKRRLALFKPTAVFPTIKILSESQLGTLAELALAIAGRTSALSSVATSN